MLPEYLSKRGTFRSTIASFVHPNIHIEGIRRQRNTVKTSLTLTNMVERDDFCKVNIKDDKITFHDMMNVIHIDEKWFYLTKNFRKYYLGIQESEPH